MLASALSFLNLMYWSFQYPIAVSYTHLDVYKRQFKHSAWASNKDVKGVKPHIVEVAVDFSDVYLEKE